MNSMRDWLAASVSERKILYRLVKVIVDRHYAGNWSRLYTDVFGKGWRFGQGYEDNFRSGRIGRTKANTIAMWLDANYPTALQSIDHELAPSTGGPDPQDWDAFVERHAVPSNLVVMRNENDTNIVGIATAPKAKIVQIPLAREFYLEVHAGQPATAMAFQRSRGDWYPMPLLDTGLVAELQTGSNILPRSAVTDAPLALSEQHQTGHCRFVVVISGSGITNLFAKDMPPGSPIPPPILAGLASKLETDKDTSKLFVQDVMFT